MRHVIALAVLAILPLAACGATKQHDRFTDARGIIETHCGSCHVVPGVGGANGMVGPPLAGIAKRQVIAGYFPNSRQNMLRWITHAQSMLPGNAMPDTNLSAEQANRVADYLYTLDK